MVSAAAEWLSQNHSDNIATFISRSTRTSSKRSIVLLIVNTVNTVSPLLKGHPLVSPESGLPQGVGFFL